MNSEAWAALGAWAGAAVSLLGVALTRQAGKAAKEQAEVAQVAARAAVAQSESAQQAADASASRLAVAVQQLDLGRQRAEELSRTRHQADAPEYRLDIRGAQDVGFLEGDARTGAFRVMPQTPRPVDEWVYRQRLLLTMLSGPGKVHVEVSLASTGPSGTAPKAVFPSDQHMVPGDRVEFLVYVPRGLRWDLVLLQMVSTEVAEPHRAWVNQIALPE